MNTHHWDITQSRTLYNINHWGDGYFDINSQGEVTVSPAPSTPNQINLFELAQNFTAQGLSLPVLVRFPDILHDRVRQLCEAFKQAMEEECYQASYTAIYPIKVNQQHHVIKEILNSGQKQVGLEAGSKSELMAIIALAPHDQTILICNGYKDREYIRLALIAQQMNLQPYLVIEKLSELQLIVEESQRFGVTPHLGIRVRLASVASGKWQNSGGEKSKFGLSAAQVLQAVEHLQKTNLLSALQLMHFHIGSQVANIRDVQNALREAARYYMELQQLKVPIQYVDVGGGLGVDYEGTGSRNPCSINYSIQEYANNIVHEFSVLCHAHQLPYPNLMTESGRAMTAHHAVLITNVIDVEAAPGHQVPEPVLEDEPAIIRDLGYGLIHLDQRSALEAYHDAIYWLSEAHTMFIHGVLNLTEKARAEQLYYATLQKVYSLLQSQSHSRNYREVIDDIQQKLANKYYCNFSLFQSAPDAWAIDQLFPIMPLHRLNEKPEYRATLQDLTCDSDGQFEHYVDGEGVGSSLPLHKPLLEQPYLLGIFLVGAYQEILGDMHNLFGDTCSVNVHLTKEGGYEWIEPLEGDTVQTMLHYVNIDTRFLRNAYRKRLQAAPLTSDQRQSYLRELEAGLVGYTYLES